jgi:hypothetical protein
MCPCGLIASRTGCWRPQNLTVEKDLVVRWLSSLINYRGRFYGECCGLVSLGLCAYPYTGVPSKLTSGSREVVIVELCSSQSPYCSIFASSLSFRCFERRKRSCRFICVPGAPGGC